MPELSFHEPFVGWIPVEEEITKASDETQGLYPRQGLKHLRVRLPDGRSAVRLNVAHQSHVIDLNILSGRCRLCGLTEADHRDIAKHGRVYRGAPANSDTAVPEPARTLPEPRTPDEAKAQAPRRARGN